MLPLPPPHPTPASWTTLLQLGPLCVTKNEEEGRGWEWESWWMHTVWVRVVILLSKWDPVCLREECVGWIWMEARRRWFGMWMKMKSRWGQTETSSEQRREWENLFLQIKQERERERVTVLILPARRPTSAWLYILTFHPHLLFLILTHNGHGKKVSEGDR